MITALALSGERPGGRAQQLSTAELETLAKDSLGNTPPSYLDARFIPAPYELLQPRQVTPQLIPACVEELTRLKDKSWFLTKQVWHLPARGNARP